MPKLDMFRSKSKSPVLERRSLTSSSSTASGQSFRRTYGAKKLKSISNELKKEGVIAQIFENQRRMPFSGFQSAFLTNRPPFSDMSGSYGSRDFKDLASCIDFPEDYGWELHITGFCDENGWSYAPNFSKFSDALDSGKREPSSRDLVRRRRWVAVPVNQKVQRLASVHKAVSSGRGDISHEQAKLRNMTKAVSQPVMVRKTLQNAKSTTNLRSTMLPSQSSDYSIPTNSRQSAPSIRNRDIREQNAPPELSEFLDSTLIDYLEPSTSPSVNEDSTFFSANGPTISPNAEIITESRASDYSDFLDSSLTNFLPPSSIGDQNGLKSSTFPCYALEHKNIAPNPKYDQRQTYDHTSDISCFIDSSLSNYAESPTNEINHHQENNSSNRSSDLGDRVISRVKQTILPKQRPTRKNMKKDKLIESAVRRFARSRSQSFVNIVSTARIVFKAARKFKSLTLRVKKPLIVKVMNAVGLRGADWTGSSDPYVLVTAHSTYDGKIGVQKFISKTSVKKKTLIPVWNEDIFLPGIDATYELCFTVLDRDSLSLADDFLGQATISLSKLKHPLRPQEIELPLDRLRTIPLEPNFSECSISDRKQAGKGFLQIALEPSPAGVSMTGFFLVNRIRSKTTLDEFFYGKSTTYTRMWVVLTGQSLYFYDASSHSTDVMTCKHTARVDVDEIASLVDEGDHFEITNGLTGTLWKLKRDVRIGSVQKRHKDRIEWLKKLSIAATLDVYTTEDAQLRRQSSFAKTFPLNLSQYQDPLAP